MVKSIEEIADLVQAELLKPCTPSGTDWLGSWAEEHRVCLKDLHAAIKLLAEIRHLPTP
jgi:hypothetical protein